MDIYLDQYPNPWIARANKAFASHKAGFMREYEQAVKLGVTPKQTHTEMYHALIHGATHIYNTHIDGAWLLMLRDSLADLPTPQK